MSRYSPTERTGINAIEQIILQEFNWIFREQPIADVGIDAHIERVDDGNPTGKLIALQIKTGSSHFTEKEEALVFYGKRTHLDYWIGHSLPVLLIAYLPESKEAFWALVNQETVALTGSAWKIEIPKKNTFDKGSLDKLWSVFEGSIAQQRLRKLSIDEPLMRHISNGGKVSVELEQWVNKSLGRTPVKVYVHDNAGNEVLSQDWFQYYVGYGIRELAEALFPWSSASVDEEFYATQGKFGEGVIGAIEDDYDEESDNYMSSHTSDGVYPYEEIAGEIERYRLVLSLNDLGSSFLILSNYMNTPSA